MELWDAFYRDGTPAGCTLVRGEPIPAGLYHQVVEVLVRHQDGDYLLMRRDHQKISYPGYWEAGAGGSVLAGESVIAGARRELREETGIIADDLTLICAQNNLKDTFYYDFLCVTGQSKQSVVLQEGETIAYRWLPREEFVRFLHSPQFVPTVRERWLPFLNKL